MIEDSTKCTNCKTCYQDMPEIFEKTQMIIDGESREVAQIIPGVLARIEVTPELKARLKRVSANCDAEIIKAHLRPVGFMATTLVSST